MQSTLAISPNYELLDPKISLLVKAINDLGIVTFWSCEGHAEMSMINSPIPTVAINLTAIENLVKLFKLVGFFNISYTEADWALIPKYDYLVLQPRINNQSLVILQEQANSLAELVFAYIEKNPQPFL